MFIHHNSGLWWICLWRPLSTYSDSALQLYWHSHLYSRILWGVRSQCVECTEFPVLITASLLQGKALIYQATDNCANWKPEWDRVQPDLDPKWRLHLERGEACRSRSPMVRRHTDCSEDRSQSLVWCHQYVPLLLRPTLCTYWFDENTVTHIALWNGKQVWDAIKQGRANGVQDRKSLVPFENHNGTKSALGKAHFEKMKVYKEVSETMSRGLLASNKCPGPHLVVAISFRWKCGHGHGYQLYR